MKIIKANNMGFCFGVKRAMDAVEDAISSGEQIYTLGPIIHNEEVLADLEKRGVKAINDLNEVDSGTIVIRAHGVPGSVLRLAKKKGLKIIDATCPFVKNVQKIAKSMEDSGLKVIIIGEKAHPEVIGIAGNLMHPIIIEHASDAESLDLRSAAGVVCQTTQSKQNVSAIMDILKNKPVKIYLRDTICNATYQQQRTACEIASRVDLMIVVGGRQSGNTKRLVELCSRISATYHVSSINDIKGEWFDNVRIVGLTAGTSTPDKLIIEVEKALKNGR